MIYSLAKALHLISLFIWIGGMLAVAVALRQPSQNHLQLLKTYDRAVTTPAMISAWTFGILLAVQGAWFGHSWLSVKVFFVLILSGLHGVLTGKLRRATRGLLNSESCVPHLLSAGMAALTVIVLLVTFKP